MLNPVNWLSSLLLFVALSGIGIAGVYACKRDIRFAEALSTGYGFGLGLFTLSLLIESWAGLPLTRTTIVLTFILFLSIFVIIIYLKKGEPKKISAKSMQRNSPWDIAGWIMLAIFWVVLTITSIGVAYDGWDAMGIWAVKGYGIGLEHTVFAASEWGSKGLAYPLNIPLAINTFFLFGSEVLPGSKFLFPGFFIAAMIGIREFFRDTHTPDWLAWLGVLLIATMPIISEHSIIGYANLPYAYYYVLGLLWIALGLQENNPARVLIGGILLGMAIWTRLEGMQFWFIAIASLLLVWQKNLLKTKMLLAVITPGLLIGGIWILFSRLNNANTGELVVLSVAVQHLLQGEIHPAAAYKIIRFTGYTLVKQRNFGVFIPFAAGISTLLVFFWRPLRDDKIFLTVLVSGLLSGLGVAFMYYLTSYDPNSDLEFWLGTGFPRMLIGAALLLGIAGILIVSKFLSLDEHTSN
jgi:preprotein translocase subunit SecG